MQTIIQTPQLFTDSWWDNLLEGTNYLTGPVTIKNSIPRDLFTEEDLSYIFRQIPHRHQFNQPSFRVYVGHGQQAKEMIEFYRNPMREDESLYQFTNRIFGDDRFGVILNNTTDLHPDLGKRLAPFYKGLTEKLGLDWVALNAIMFIGNYGYTPFGAHYDGAGTSIIHFHLGPGKKVMTLWDEETFIEKTGSRLHYPYPEKIVPYGTDHIIEAYDTFYLPEGPFHIGNTEEFSMALTISINGITVKDWLVSAIAEMNSNAFNPEILVSHETNIDEVFSQEIINHEVKDLPFSHLIKTAMEDYQLSIKSNCGFQVPRWSDNQTYNDLANQRIQAVQPFQMYYKALNDNQVRLYFRRNKQNFTEANAIIPIIEQLNDGQTLEVGQVLAQNSASKEYLSEFFTLLLNHQAIELA